MYGGGYIFSGDIARALHLTNKVGGLQQGSSRVWGGGWLHGGQLRVLAPLGGREQF